jgi:hypothetical protein
VPRLTVMQIRANCLLWELRRGVCSRAPTVRAIAARARPPAGLVLAVRSEREVERLKELKRQGHRAPSVDYIVDTHYIRHDCSSHLK